MNTAITAVHGWLVRRWLIAAMVALVGIGGCVTNPATGKKEFSLLSVEDEKAIGAQADQEIVAQYGVYQDAAVSAYVNQIGQKLAAVAENPGYGFTFRVLDSPVINAFALPGGYIYVTRGTLAHLQNDAQLAVILGHEIAHVTARHAAEQYTKAQLAGIGLGLGSVLFEDIRPFAGAIESGLQLLFLKFSRDNELQSDDLGVKYAVRAGYQGSEGSEFFRTLRRLTDQENGGRLPTWASTHPDPGDRENRIIQLAAQYAQQISPTGGLGGVNPETYIPRLNNMVFGPDPRQGFVESGVFYHPALAFQFPIPSGWQYVNFASLIQMAPANGEAAMEMSTVANTTPQAAASTFINGLKPTVLEQGATNVNGLSAYRLRSNVSLDDGQGGAVPLAIVSYFIQKDNLVYVFHGYALQQAFASYAGVMEGTMRNFARVTNSAVLNVQPYVLRTFAAPRTDQFRNLVTTPGAKRGAEISTSIETLAIMNQRETTESVQAGEQLKKVE